jgi:hypothetical protein
MIELYQNAFRFYRSSLPALLIFACLIEGLIWLFQPKHVNFILWVPHLIIIYQFHRHYLFGEAIPLLRQPSNARPQRFGWFILLSTALLIVPTVLGLGLAFRLTSLNMPQNSIVNLMLLTTGLLYLIALSLFGTALPATVARSGQYRLSAGLKMTFGTMWRLAASAGLVQVILFALLTSVDQAFLDSPTYQTEAVQVPFAIIGTTLSFLPSLLGVAVLCQMYEKIIAAAPEPENAKAGQT